MSAVPCRTDRWVIALLACVAALALPAAWVMGQEPAAPADKAAAVPGARESHGWMTIRDDRDQSTLLLHLPPRSAGGDPWGTVRIAPGVAHPTERVTGFGDRAWLVLQPERREDGYLRRVVTIRAVRSLGGSWDYPPGRPEVCSPLPGHSELVGLAGTARGPVALLRGRDGGGGGELAAGAWGLLLLTGSGWHELPLPWEGAGVVGAGGPAPGDVVQLVGMAGAAGVLLHPAGGARGGPAILWRATIPGGHDASDLTGTIWSRSTIPIAALPAGWMPDAVYQIGDGRSEQLIGTRWTSAQEIEIAAYRAGGATIIATVPAIPRVHRAAAMDGTGSLAFLWWEAAAKPATTTIGEPKPGSTAARVFKVTEVSASTGRLIYEGPALGAGVFSAREFQAVAVTLLLVTAVVLLFALRSDAGPPLELPAGLALAPPLPRLIAAMADFCPGILLASMSMGVDIQAMFSPTIFIGPSAEPTVWSLALALTVIHCTMGEWLTGRSLGKSLVGIQVVAVRAGAEAGDYKIGRLRLWQAVVRNVIRWGVPVLGILLLVDVARRYPADMAARTLVVVPLDEEEDED